MPARVRSWLQRARLMEAAALASLLLIVGSIWMFVAIASEVSEGEFRHFDEWALRSLRTSDGTSAIGPRWVLAMARDLTALGSATVITRITASAIGFLALQRKWGALWLVLASIAGGSVVSWLLKDFFNRE